MKYTEYNEDAGRNEFGAHLESESRKYSALQSLLAGKLLEKDEIESLREFKFVQQFLDSPIGDASEAKLKKAFAAAVIMAQEQGTLPFSLADKSPIAIASAIDEGLNRVKFAYKVSKEELDVVEVADKLIDATVARAVTVADKVIERGVSVRGCSRPSLLVRHSLVHDIPAVNYVLVAGYNSIDVALHIGIELILGEEFALFILIDPLAYLAVPYQAVSTELDAIAAAEISNLVGIFPVIDAFLRLC